MHYSCFNVTIEEFVFSIEPPNQIVQCVDTRIWWDNSAVMDASLLVTWHVLVASTCSNTSNESNQAVIALSIAYITSYSNLVT